MNTEIELVPAQPDESRMKQLIVWDDFREQAEKLKTTAETLAVTNVSQIAEMKLARVTRLTIKDLRVAITHRHKELKADVLEEGRKIDAGKNELLKILEPLEERLLLQETFAERETKRLLDEKRDSRAAELVPYLAQNQIIVVDLASLTDEQYAEQLRNHIAFHEAKIAREAAEKIAAFEAAEKEKIRLEAQRVENGLLRKEAAEREIERKAAEIEKARLLRQLEDERRTAQAKANAEIIRVRSEKAVVAAKEKAARDAIELRARKDREAVEALAKSEREARQKIESEIAAQKVAELKAKNVALLAPDKEKLLAFSKSLWEVPRPVMATDKGETFLKDVILNTERLVAYIQNQANNL